MRLPASSATLRRCSPQRQGCHLAPCGAVQWLNRRTLVRVRPPKPAARPSAPPGRLLMGNVAVLTPRMLWPGEPIGRLHGLHGRLCAIALVDSAGLAGASRFRRQGSRFGSVDRALLFGARLQHCTASQHVKHVHRTGSHCGCSTFRAGSPAPFRPPNYGKGLRRATRCVVWYNRICTQVPAHVLTFRFTRIVDNGVGTVNQVIR